MEYFEYQNIDQDELIFYFNQNKSIEIIIPKEHYSACKTFLKVNYFYKIGINEKFGFVKMPFMFIWGAIQGVRVSFFHTNLMFISVFFQMVQFSKYEFISNSEEDYILKFSS